MATKTVVPRFKSEREEAEWWDAHPEIITELFLKAKKEGKIKRLPVIRGATRRWNANGRRDRRTAAPLQRGTPSG
jgi:hypothetical protein